MIDNLRDVVLILVGLVWSLIFLAILAVTVVVFVVLRKYLNMAHALLRQRARPFLGDALAVAEALQVQTASLPHYGSADRRLPATPRGTPIKLTLSWPFFRRRKPWYQRLIGQ